MHHYETRLIDGGYPLPSTYRVPFHAHTTHSATGASLSPGHVLGTVFRPTCATRTLHTTVSGVNSKRFVLMLLPGRNETFVNYLLRVRRVSFSMFVMFFNVVFSMFVCYSAAFCQLRFYNKDWIGSTKRRHQSPEWTILSHVNCFIQGEVVEFQIVFIYVVSRRHSSSPSGKLLRSSWYSDNNSQFTVVVQQIYVSVVPELTQGQTDSSSYQPHWQRSTFLHKSNCCLQTNLHTHEECREWAIKKPSPCMSANYVFQE